MEENLRNDWSDRLSERIGVGRVDALAQDAPLPLMVELLFSENDIVARNAAWVLTHKSDSDIATLPQVQLVHLATTTQQSAIRRMVLSLILRHPMKKEEVNTAFLDFCLSHMTMLEEPTAVQALCMKLAYRMCAFYPELMREFDENLRLMPAEFYKPGVKCLIKKYKLK